MVGWWCKIGIQYFQGVHNLSEMGAPCPFSDLIFPFGATLAFR